MHVSGVYESTIDFTFLRLVGRTSALPWIPHPYANSAPAGGVSV